MCDGHDVLFGVAELVEVLVTPVSGLAAVSLAGYLLHLFTKRRTAEQRYDDAIGAVARLQAERHAGNIRLPGELVQAEGDELARITQELSVEGVRRFLEARAASCACGPLCLLA